MSTADEWRSAMDNPVVRRHLAIGWWSLLLFLTLGLVLEALHGFKVGWYIDVSSHTRRLMLTLAHAHGTLLAVVHIAYAATLFMLNLAKDPRREMASKALTGATILIPGGFFFGGIFIWGGDPGLGIILVPIGGVLLVTSVLLTAASLRRSA